MNHKVLLADDSLTIQKVIKITLANQPFEITDCSTDGDLFKLLPETKPEIVFLDFNLSEKYSGYELCSKIKEISPEAQVLFLLGTFDVVDDAAMEKCGAADKIVKPFDSNKFISICKRLVDNAPIEEIIFPSTNKPKEIEIEVEDHWTVNDTVEKTASPEMVTSDHSKPFNVRDHLNPLDQEISEWGMSVPGIINDAQSSDKKIDLPPVIINEPVKKQASPVVDKKDIKDEAKFPSADDLDFPDMGGGEIQVETEVPAPASASKLISIDTFHNVQDQTGEFEIEHTISSVVETDISSIEDQIRAEVEEDLWQVDEFENVKNAVAEKIDELKDTHIQQADKFEEELFKPLDSDEELEWDVGQTTQSIPTSSGVSQDVIMSQLRSELASLIKKEVKEYMDQMFKQQVEKVSWEVIPDLAENLIKKEISKISNKILNDSN